MPAVELMGWNKTQRRWFKKYRGKMYSISPRQLGTEATKEASRQAANDWWTKKQKEVDEQLGIAKKHPTHVVTHYQTAIENHRVYAKWHRKYGNAQEAEKSEAVMEWLHEALTSDDPPFPLNKRQFDPLYEEKRDDMRFNIWIERLSQIWREEREEKAVPKENTIRAHIDDYLAVCMAGALAQGKLCSYDSIHYHMTVFRKWVDPFAKVESLNEALWERYCLYLAKQVTDGKIAPATRKGHQGAVRAFIHNRHERRFIELPRNLRSRNLSPPLPLKEVEPFTVEEIKQLLDEATERTQLYILLMLNCGMYPVDIALLRQDEVDWDAGRIARKRTKTRDRSPNVPKVDYLLWQETFALLTKHRSKRPDLVLVNTNDAPLWQYKEKNGKVSKIRNIHSAYRELMRSSTLPKEQHKPLKALRKTPSSMLENHAEYGRYAEYFLGEAPKTVASRHYIKPSREQFDKALKWLGEQFGFTTAPIRKPGAAKAAGKRQRGRGGQRPAQRGGRQGRDTAADTRDSSPAG